MELNSVVETTTSIENLSDEIREQCATCGHERFIAYWDEELEYYIYLQDPLICPHC